MPLLKITIKVNGDNLTVQIPHIDFYSELRNIMAVDPGNNMVVDIGENQTEFEENFPEIWEKHKNAIQFVNPFNFNAHGVDFAHALLWHYAQVAQRKPGSIILPKRLVSIEFDLWLVNYEAQSEKLRQKFEYILVKDKKLDVKKLSINGTAPDIETQFEDIKRRNKQQMKIEWTLWITIFVWFGMLIMTSNALWASLGLTSIGSPIVDLAIFAIIFILLLMAGVVLGTSTWAMIARRYLPFDTIKKFFPRQKILKDAVNTLLTQLGFFSAN